MPCSTYKICKILCGREHWGCEEELIPRVNDLNLVSDVCRQKGKHGGAAVYINEKLISKPRKELNGLSVVGQFECASAEGLVENETILVLTIYRPSNKNSDVRVFFEQLQKVLNIISDEKKSIIVSVDFNIDLSDEMDHNYKLEFLSIMQIFQFSNQLGLLNPEVVA
ncbi:hypothetical protein HHI36_002145 [Cryptolaemus montrouzieri]|uniref:Endonuclease/exonuclease/phosphatase domain-containing protein n=1 Tax=Cryptolaemus montrouzieri TaxID=559131 RepID=A0ABD2PAD7_9CUCU